MKNLILFFIVQLSIFQTAFAQSRLASKEEKRELCQAIDSHLEAQSADMAIDLKTCQEERMLSDVTEHDTLVIGRINFNSPNGISRMTCSLVLTKIKDIPRCD